ncbi:MAG: DUF4366 domain-containing protein [Ruminococcus sp.]|nr:DUF4366 domain-containing protein [Ruminococcus sp.]
MRNAKKSFTTLFSAMALTLASVGMSVTAFAEETTAIVNDASSYEVCLSDEEMNSLLDELESANDGNETDESSYDYYTNDYYDTDGNATLIKYEEIIYDSEEMQFIAVTTKDGNVFYILINYSADGEEDNVYFLNKVDDFDLYSLLYAKSESEDENIDPAEQAQKYADAATGGNTSSSGKSESDSDADTEAEEAETTGENESVESSTPMNSNLIILVGVGALTVVGVIIFVLKSGKLSKKKNNKTDDFDEEYEDDYGAVEDEDDA